MLEVKHVCYGIDGVPILKDISLGVQKGCIVTIVGPNGCGKSTLLKIISRILRPQSGEVLLDGCDVRTANTRSLARRMAILPQRKNVAVDLTVEQLVQYGRYPHTGFGGKLTKRDIDKDIKKPCNRNPFWGRKPNGMDRHVSCPGSGNHFAG